MGTTYWTRERLISLLEEKKFENVSAFWKTNSGAYTRCLNFEKDLLDRYFPNRIRPHTKEDIQHFIEINNITTRAELVSKNKALYNTAIQKFPEILPKKCGKTWNLDMVTQVALKYRYRSNFQVYDKGAYLWALSHKVLNSVCGHMVPKASLKTRMVYVYEFKDMYAYVGITWNIKNRSVQHIKVGPVFEHIQACNKYKLKILEDSIPMQEACDREEYWIEQYKNKGYRLLNCCYPVRSLGANAFKYSIKYLIKVARSYKTKKNFIKYRPREYSAIRSRGLINTLCAHMYNKVGKSWTNKELLVEAKKYKTRIDFKQSSTSAYQLCYERGLLQKACNHMPVNLRKQKVKCVQTNIIFNSCIEAIRGLNISHHVFYKKVSNKELIYI